MPSLPVEVVVVKIPSLSVEVVVIKIPSLPIDVVVTTRFLPVYVKIIVTIKLYIYQQSLASISPSPITLYHLSKWHL